MLFDHLVEQRVELKVAVKLYKAVKRGAADSGDNSLQAHQYDRLMLSHWFRYIDYCRFKNNWWKRLRNSNFGGCLPSFSCDVFVLPVLPVFKGLRGTWNLFKSRDKPPPNPKILHGCQQDCFLNSWISSNSCNLLLPAEISAGKWDFILSTHLSIPLPCMSLYSHCRKKAEEDVQVFTTWCLF